MVKGTCSENQQRLGQDPNASDPHCNEFGINLAVARWTRLW